MGTATYAAAQNLVNGTPTTAIPFSSLPFTGSTDSWYQADEATDAASQRVATACNAASPIYGPAYWRYDATQASTFVVHAAEFQGIASYEPIGLAVLAGDASTVIECGTGQVDISKTGALSIAAGESRLIVAYLPAAQDSFYGPLIGVYPSSGVVPANDEPENATAITSLPFTTTQDTTLATTNFGGVGCFNKFGRGPEVWFSWNAPRTDLVQFGVTANYDVHTAVAPVVNGEVGESTCDEVISAHAGTQYLIAIWGTSDDLQQTGTFSLNAAFLPPVPALSLNIDAAGTVNKKTGVVKVSGTLGCAGGTDVPSLQGTVRQVYKRVIQSAPLSFTGVTGCATSSRWMGTATSTTYLFTGGVVDVTVTATACNQRGCSTVSAQKSVKLKVA
ncbi:hypothetical protein [Phycicoccus sp. Soil802]|uniref:hypothetical protein n=1 Tax=Phycicoccus sp. Soil802 TaxID=1736414 RepID=UPI000703422B|nr:hypothetical protein [Phycicoccus sp. Soil802]KRF28550.1 hypothetical protein ASG91_08885 [Phycicoccus sp. Soil802]